ncbi:MAG: 2-C-methyl-D-erythritol 4-phosphate cytidylyltransferase, partial [Candidatus Zixiibacteriota bacterium]
MKRNICIIVAAGRGKRINTGLPKQFLKIGDRPLLAYTIERFEECPQIAEIVL